jgi:hypothetical protein
MDTTTVSAECCTMPACCLLETMELCFSCWFLCFYPFPNVKNAIRCTQTRVERCIFVHRHEVIPTPRGVSRVSRGCLAGVSRVSRGCLAGVSRAPPASLKRVAETEAIFCFFKERDERPAQSAQVSQKSTNTAELARKALLGPPRTVHISRNPQFRSSKDNHSSHPARLGKPQRKPVSRVPAEALPRDGT